MNLIPEWKSCWSKLWSIRLSLFAAVASGIEAGVDIWLTGKPPIFAVVAFFVSLGAAVARLVAQPNARNGRADRSSD